MRKLRPSHRVALQCRARREYSLPRVRVSIPTHFSQLCSLSLFPLSCSLPARPPPPPPPPPPGVAPVTALAPRARNRAEAQARKWTNGLG